MPRARPWFAWENASKDNASKEDASKEQTAVPRVIAFFLTFMVATQAGYLFAFPPNTSVGVFWPAAGLTLAVLLLEDVRVWPAYAIAVFVGEFIGVAERGLPLAICLTWSVAAMGEPILAAWVLRGFGRTRFDLCGVKDVVALVAVGCVISPCITAAWSATTAVWWLDAPSWSTHWISWWFGDAMGVLVVAPLLLVWLTRVGSSFRPWEVLLGLLLMASVGLAADSSFGVQTFEDELWLIPGFVAVPLMLLSALRFELRGVTVAAAILNGVAAYHTTRGRGMFAELGDSPFEHLLSLQAYLSSATLSSLVLGAALVERRRGQHQLQDMIDNASAVIFAKRADGTYLFVNKAFERITGASRKDVVGRTTSDVWGQAYATTVATTDREVLRTGQPRLTEEEIATPLGPHTYAGVRFPLVGEDGKPYAVCGMATDITARKRAEEALQRSEERLQFVVAATHDAVYDLDVVTGTVWRSDRYRELFGATAGRETWIRRIHPDDRSRVLASLSAAVDSQARNWSSEHRLLREDGAYAHVLDDAYLLYLPDGEHLRTIGAVADVTERYQAQLAIQNANAELERRVERRTAELATAFEQMESFSYSISHDLRGPLRAINGFGRALEDELGTSLTPLSLDYLSRIRAASRQMGDLIDDLLTLSRAGRGEVRHEQVDLERVARSVVDDLREIEPARNVTVEVEPGLSAWGDPGLLRIVLQNLISNAWKFSGGHAAARIKVASTRIEPEGGGALQTAYYVQDDGAGFDPSYTAKLFRPFERLHRANEFPGTGIGLATTERIIARHGGRVWALGAVEAGATFYFTLPDGAAPDGAAPEPEAAAWVMSARSMAKS